LFARPVSFRRSLEVGTLVDHLVDLPVVPSGIGDVELAGDRASLGDSLEVDSPRREHDIGPDVSLDGNPHFAKQRFVEDHHDAGRLQVGELPGVHRDFNLGLLAAGEGFFRRPDCRATAGRGDLLDVHIFLVEVVDRDAVLGIGSASHDSEVVFQLAEHLLGPGVTRFLRRRLLGGRRPIRTERNHQEDGRSDEACHTQ